MVDKERAISLRESGMSYKEIAELCGCSVSWCKLNLKDVSTEKELTNTQLYDRICTLMLEVERRVKG